MNKAFVLGSLNMDFIISVNQMPQIGETIQGKAFQSSPGGKGSNQAVALAKQGIETYMIGSIGDDMIGKEIRNSLKNNHVHNDYIQVIDNQSSGIAIIILEKDDNRIITSLGANAHHDIDQIKKQLNQRANQNDLLLTQLEIPLDVIEKSLLIAKKIGMKTILNAAPIKDLSHNILTNVDLLIVNQTEAERLTESKIKSGDMEIIINKLKRLGPSEIILTLGKDGSYYSNESSTIFTPAYQINQVIDTTGAGDAFIGCFLAQKLKQQSNQISLRYASACGAVTVTKKGVHHAIPSLIEIEDFIKKRGIMNG